MNYLSYFAADAAIDVKGSSVIQESEFNELYPRRTYPFKYIHQSVMSKFPVINVSPVTQGTV